MPKAKSTVAGTAWAEIVESLLSRSVAAELVREDLEALVVNTVDKTTEETYEEVTESESTMSSGGQAVSSHGEGKFRNTRDFSADALRLERSNGLHEISRLMDAYQASLASLQPLLAKWNPGASTYLVSIRAHRDFQENLTARIRVQRSSPRVYLLS